MEIMQCTVPLPEGSAQCDSRNALPQCVGDSTTWNSCNALFHCLAAVRIGTHALHCLTAWEQPGVQLLPCTASLHWG